MIVPPPPPPLTHTNEVEGEGGGGVAGGGSINISPMIMRCRQSESMWGQFCEYICNIIMESILYRIQTETGNQWRWQEGGVRWSAVFLLSWAALLWFGWS